MLNEPSDSPQQNTHEPASPAWKPNRGVYNAGPSQFPAPPRPQPTAAPSIRRPGCVTVTVGVFFLIALFSLLGLLQSMLLLDVVLVVVNAAQIGLALATVYGLMEMYRWGANLVIIFCAGTIFQWILQAVYMSLLIGDYLDSPIAVTSYVIVILIMTFVIIVILGLIMGWFVRVRKWFLPGNLPQKIEHRLYLAAIIFVLLSTVVSLTVLPEVLENQQPLFDQINRQSVGPE
ncbi:MAG: hypothetical protein L0154_24880 [Chloroflexi bacterium]|nr:hypothetical protein [Chloroflexota bacterium]